MEGDFFCFLDSDDMLTPNSLHSRLEVFKRGESLEYVDGAILIMDHDLKKIIAEWVPCFTGKPFEDLVSLSGRSFFGNTWMIKRVPGKKYFMRAEFSHGEDLVFYLDISRTNSGDYHYTKDYILKYRKHNSSAMKNLDGLVTGYQQIAEILKSELNISPKLYKKYCERANRIITLSYLRYGNFRSALTKRI